MGILARCFGLSDQIHKSSSPNSPFPLIEQLCQRFSLAQMKKSTNNFDETRMVGRGPYGAVYKGWISIDGKDCAVAIKRFKKVSNQSRSKQRLSQLKNEILLLCQLRHTNLVSLFGFCDEKDEMILVYEFMLNGSLSIQLCYRFGNIEPLSWAKRLEICIGAAHGLHYLHTGVKRTIFHRHMRPSNILLDENLVPKIADFGFSLLGPTFTGEAKPVEVKEIVGKYKYLAPEYAMYGKVTDKADVYSFGMILLEVVCPKKLDIINDRIAGNMKEDWNSAVNRDHGDEDKDDDDCDEREILQKYTFRNLAREVRNSVQNGSGENAIDPFLNGKIAPKCWELFIDIAERCLLEEPNERPTMVDVEAELEHALELQEENGPGNSRASRCQTPFVSPDTECSFPQPEEANSEGIAAEHSSTSHGN